MQGGMKREWAKPLNPKPCTTRPYGNWAGAGQIFNILGCQPGWRYTLASDSDIDNKLYKGYEIVDTAKGHTEKFVGYGRVATKFGSAPTSLMKLGPYYLVRIPVREYAAIRKRARDRRNAGMDIPTKSLLSQNSLQAETLRSRSPRYLPKDGQVYTRYPEHGENGYAIEEVEVNRG